MAARLHRARLAVEPKDPDDGRAFRRIDEITRDRLNEQLQQLRQRERRTVVFVTHPLPRRYLSTKIVVMSPRSGRYRQG